MSYFRRGYSWEQIHYLTAPTGGWNPDVVPWLLPQGQAQILDNFVTGDGYIQMRGGLFQNNGFATTPANVCGCVLFDSSAGAYPGFLTGHKAVSTTATIDHWNAPLLQAASNTQLGKSTGTLYLNAGTPVVSALAPGPRFINFDGLTYGITYDGTTSSQDTNAVYTIWNTQVYTAPMRNISAAPTLLPNAPQGALDLKGHLQRIWLLGGVDTPGAGTTHSPTSLFFTNPISSGGGTASADWKDPVSGLTNVIRLDQNNSDCGVGLATFRSQLLVFRRNSVWALRGTTTASFTAQLVSRETGCLDARSIVETDRGVYFMSQRGLMLTDGVRVQNVSGNVKETLGAALQQFTQYTMTYKVGGWITAAPLYDGHIMISIGVAHRGVSGVDGHQAPLWSAIYNPATNAWSRITSNIWQTDGVTAGSQASTQQNSAYNYPGMLVCRPERKQVYVLGDRFITQVEEFGQSGGTPTSIVLPSSGAQMFDIPSGSTTYQPIPARWLTAFPPVVGTASRKFGQAKRFFIDYNYNSTVFGAGNYLGDGWTVTPVTPAGVPVTGASALTVPANTPANGSVVGAPTLSSPTIERANQDFFSEISDFAFDVKPPASTDTRTFVSGSQAIYGIGIEFQPGKDLR